MVMRLLEKKLLCIVFGALLGFFLAVVVSYFCFPLTGQVDPDFLAKVVDSHHQIYPEQREVNFYRLCVIFGVGFGSVGLYCQRFIRWYLPVAIGSILLVPALNFTIMTMIKSISKGDFYSPADVAAESMPTALLSTVPFMVILIIVVIVSMKGLKRGKNSSVVG